MFAEQIQTLPYKGLFNDFVFVCFGQTMLYRLIVLEVISN
jgi:hypothetical protein